MLPLALSIAGFLRLLLDHCQLLTLHPQLGKSVLLRKILKAPLLASLFRALLNTFLTAADAVLIGEAGPIGAVVNRRAFFTSGSDCGSESFKNPRPGRTLTPLPATVPTRLDNEEPAQLDPEGSEFNCSSESYAEPDSVSILCLIDPDSEP